MKKVVIMELFYISLLDESAIFSFKDTGDHESTRPRDLVKGNNLIYLRCVEQWTKT